MTSGWTGTLFMYAEGKGRVLLPEGVTVERFMNGVNGFEDFGDTVQKAHGAAEVGDISLVAGLLEQIVKLHEGFTPWALRGLPKHNSYVMARAITKRLENGNPITPEVRGYAKQYSLELAAIVRA